MKTDTPEKCTHKLAEMPRWLSSKKMEVVKSLLADDPVRQPRAYIQTPTYCISECRPNFVNRVALQFTGDAVRCPYRIEPWRLLLLLLQPTHTNQTHRMPPHAHVDRLRESMGVGADSTQKAFYTADIAALLARSPTSISRCLYEEQSRENTNHVLVRPPCKTRSLLLSVRVAPTHKSTHPPPPTMTRWPSIQAAAVRPRSPLRALLSCLRVASWQVLWF